MRHFKFIFVLFALVLAACSEVPMEKFNNFMAEKDYNGAISWLEGELENKKKATDPLLNALAAEMRIKRCFMTNCFEDTPGELIAFAEHLKHIGDGKVNMPEDAGTRDTYQNISSIVNENVSAPTFSDNLLQIIQAVPEGAPKQMMYELGLNSVVEKLKLMDAEGASRLLIMLSELGETQDFNSHYAAFLSGLINYDLNILNTRIAALAAQAQDVQASAALNMALPYALFFYEIKVDPKNGSTAFVNAFFDNVKGFNIKPLLTETSMADMAKSVQSLPQNNRFMLLAKEHFIKPYFMKTAKPQPVVQPVKEAAEGEKIAALPNIEVEEEEASTEPAIDASIDSADSFITLKLFKQSLLLNADNQTLWEQYLPQALEFSNFTGDTSLITGLNTDKMPPVAAKGYNTQLVEVINEQIKLNQDVTALIAQMIIPPAEQDSLGFAKQRDILISQALAKAIANKDIETAIRYADLSPDVARQQRQNIVTLLISGIEEQWQQDNFDVMLSLAEFLVKDMGIDFNLDSLLLQNFDTYLQEIKINDLLKAETPDDLLKAQAEVQIDLGTKFTFIEEYFSASNPAIIDTQLKNLMLKAEGQYGVPTALYKMDYLFKEELFPKIEREKFFVSALKKSLRTEKNYDAPKMAEIGYALYEKHEKLPLLFVVAETLNRITTLQSGRRVWNNSQTDFKAILKAVKPQFYALMEGIDAFEKNKLSEAASKFVVLADPEYVMQAEEYIKKYREKLIKLTGIYVLDEPSNKTNIILIGVQPATNGIDFNAVQRALENKRAAQTARQARAQQEAIATEESIETNEQRETAEPDAINTSSESGSNEELIEITDFDLTGLRFSFINAVGTVKTVVPEKLTEDFGKTFKSMIDANINPDKNTTVFTARDLSSVREVQSFIRTYGRIGQITFKEAGMMDMRVEGLKDPLPLHRIADKVNLPLFPNGIYGITTQLSVPNETTDHVLPVGSILSLQTNTKDAIQPMKDGKKLSVIFPVQGTLKHPAAPRDNIVVEGFYDTDKHTVNLVYRYPYGQDRTKLDAIVRCHIPDTYLVCAGHNRHWDRSQHSHIVTGLRVLTKAEKEAQKALEENPNTKRYAPEVKTFEPTDLRPPAPHEKSGDTLY